MTDTSPDPDVDPRRAANRATFTAIMEAITRGDYDALGTMVTEDLEFELPYGPSFIPNPIEGRDTWMAMSTATFKMFSSFVQHVDAVYDLVDPDLLIAEYHSDAVVTHNGNAYRNRYIGVLRFRDGLVCAWKEFHNPEATQALT
ncbi:MAG: nuclear transport factor 2 family protein [Actinobacteria bacterium]|nr:nuclear transport factor 2 family protein [Actinomycetota bacterium]